MRVVGLLISLLAWAYCSTATADVITEINYGSRAAHYLQLQPTAAPNHTLAPQETLDANLEVRQLPYNRLLEVGPMEVIRKITVEAAGTAIRPDAFNLGLHIALNYEFI